MRAKDISLILIILILYTGGIFYFVIPAIKESTLREKTANRHKFTRDSILFQIDSLTLEKLKPKNEIILPRS